MSDEPVVSEATTESAVDTALDKGPDIPEFE